MKRCSGYLKRPEILETVYSVEGGLGFISNLGSWSTFPSGPGRGWRHFGLWATGGERQPGGEAGHQGGGEGGHHPRGERDHGVRLLHWRRVTEVRLELGGGSQSTKVLLLQIIFLRDWPVRLLLRDLLQKIECWVSAQPPGGRDWREVQVHWGSDWSQGEDQTGGEEEENVPTEAERLSGLCRNFAAMKVCDGRQAESGSGPAEGSNITFLYMTGLVCSQYFTTFF